MWTEAPDGTVGSISLRATFGWGNDGIGFFHSLSVYFLWHALAWQHRAEAKNQRGTISMKRKVYLLGPVKPACVQIGG